MKSWTREIDLDPRPGAQCKEVWRLHEEGRIVVSCELDVTVGKPLDILGLKVPNLGSLRGYAKFLKETAGKLYGTSKDRRLVRACPCCDLATTGAAEELKVYGVPYHRCAQCGHVFVRLQPFEEALNEVFTESEEHASTYTDVQSLEIRLDQVIKPKIHWLTDVYRKHYCRELATVLDVGAGGGHFVEGLRRLGVDGEGYEMSRASRRFAKDVFGIELREADFLQQPISQGRFDVIAFWGLLEYTSEPKKFVQSARKWFDHDRGMLVIEVPRYGSFGTALQEQFPDTVTRHMDPTSHINCFSDASMAFSLLMSGFKPVAIWYFGMDIYELIIQLALEVDDQEMIKRLGRLIPRLQGSLDYGRLCDDMIVAAIPF